mgnify:CR=1 FL=1
MADRISILGIGVIGGFGTGRGDLVRALEKPGGPNGELSLETSTGEKSCPAYVADLGALEDYLPKRRLRRLGHFAQMATLGGCLALEDAGMLEEVPGEQLGIVIASGYGPTTSTFQFLDMANREGDECVSPTLFSNSAHSVAPSTLSILLEITGPALTVSQFEMSVPVALLNAVQWLRQGRVRYVLFGALDEHCSVRTYSHARIHGENADGELRPMATDEQSAVLGEGAAFFVLGRDESPRKPLARIREVEVMNLREEGLHFPPEVPVLIGADGHPLCGRLYERYLPDDSSAASFTPVYGSLPVGQAFDLAIASLACHRNSLWTPPAPGSPTPLPRGFQSETEAGNGVACLCIDRRATCGKILADSIS